MAERALELIITANGRGAIKELRSIADQGDETTESLKGNADEQTLSMDKVRGATVGLRDAMFGLAAMVGIGGLAFGFKDLVTGGMALQQQQVQLAAALKATGQNAQGAQDQLQKYAEGLSTKGGFATTQNLSALTAFVRETHNATEAQKMLALATNIARGRNIDLATAQMVVQRAYTGSVGKLQALLGPMVAAKEATVGLTVAHQREIAQLQNQAQLMGPLGQMWLRQQMINDHLTAQQQALATMTDKHATAQMVLAAATQAFAGSTSSYSRTAAGQMSNLRNSVNNLVETLGVSLLPAFTKIVHVLQPVAEWMAKNKTVVLAVTGALTALGAAYGIVTAATKAWAAIQVILDAELTANPIGLIIVGVVALGVAVYEVVKHWRTFENVAVSAWKAVERAVTAGVNWIAQKLKWVAGIAVSAFSDTPLGGLINAGSALLGGHVGRAFGDVVQGNSFGMVNPNAGTVGLPGNNITHIGTINLVTSDRQIGNATIRYQLNRAARGPTSMIGGSLVTGSPGAPSTTLGH